MIETEYRVSKARSSTERVLAFFLWFGMIVHGLFFTREWLAAGVIFGFAGVWSAGAGIRAGRKPLQDREEDLTKTDGVLLAMAAFSLFGLGHPVQATDGWLETLRWTIYWLVYRWARKVYSEQSREWLIRQIQLLAVITAVIGWLPWAGLVWSSPAFPEAGRLNSWFGYPNAMAAFLGAILLIRPLNPIIRAFLLVSFLSTGSRAAIGLFAIVFAARSIVLNLSRKRWTKHELRNILFWVYSCLRLAGIMTAGALALSLFLFQPAWAHLWTWGFSSASWGDRLLYYKDGLTLAWLARGWPRAGGWLAFPTVQHIPYWTSDPHSSLIRVLLNQGVLAIVALGLWGIAGLRQQWLKVRNGEGEITSGDRAGYLSALLFLFLHSLIDVDLSFGALGIMFWLIVGIVSSDRARPLSKPAVGSYLKALRGGGPKVILGLSFLLLGGCLTALIQPNLFDQGRLYSIKAGALSVAKPLASIQLWQRAIDYDQTRGSWRQNLAELLFRQGDLTGGLKEVENVLAWQPLDLSAYEWAQGLVWQAAETGRIAGNAGSKDLYNWIMEVPARIKKRAQSISPFERALWPGYEGFRPSPHIELIVEYARKRAFTTSPP